jgi:hypothetical protein
LCFGTDATCLASRREKRPAWKLRNHKRNFSTICRFLIVDSPRFSFILLIFRKPLWVRGPYQAESGDPSFGIDDAKVSTLKYGAQFYETLQANGRDAVYNGPAVTAADADKVLLRWKLDDNQYRVICGNLGTGDIDATRLPELEGK